MRTMWYIDNKHIPVELHESNGQYFLEILEEKYCDQGRFISISDYLADSIMRQCEEEQIENNHLKYIKHT